MKSKKITAAVGVTGTLLSLGLIAGQITPAFAETTKVQSKFEIREKPGFLNKVEHTKKNLVNGIEITITSNDAEVITKLQTSHQPVRTFKENSKVSINKINLENGVKISITSNDSEVVKKLQSTEKPIRKMAKKIKHFHQTKNLDRKIDKSIKNMEKTNQ